MKLNRYFLAFEYFGGVTSKFMHAVVVIDIEKTLIVNKCKELISERYPNLDVEDLTIKVTSFNLV